MGWREGGGRRLQGGGEWLECIIWSLLVPRSVFVSSLNFTASGFVAQRPVSGVTLGDFSSVLRSHVLEIPSQEQKQGLARVLRSVN